MKKLVSHFLVTDSLALLFLLNKFSKKNNFQIISMIVDHGLREDLNQNQYK